MLVTEEVQVFTDVSGVLSKTYREHTNIDFQSGESGDKVPPGGTRVILRASNNGASKQLFKFYDGRIAYAAGPAKAAMAHGTLYATSLKDRELECVYIPNAGAPPQAGGQAAPPHSAPAASKAAPTARVVAPADPAALPAVGARVLISGLLGRPELNGKYGRAASFNDATNRYNVRVEASGETVALRPANLEVERAADARPPRPSQPTAPAAAPPASSTLPARSARSGPGMTIAVPGKTSTVPGKTSVVPGKTSTRPATTLADRSNDGDQASSRWSPEVLEKLADERERARLREGLPPPWGVKRSKSNGKYYYNNPHTRENRFERPRSVAVTNLQGQLKMEVFGPPPSPALHGEPTARSSSFPPPWSGPRAADVELPALEPPLEDEDRENCLWFGSEGGCFNSQQGRVCSYKHASPNTVELCKFGNACLRKASCSRRHREVSRDK